MPSHKNSVRYLTVLLSISAGLFAQSNAKPDNTATNKQDQSASQPTADQGKNNKSDLELARQIRRSVVKDKSLSTYGHNVKIIAQGGKVTLRGPVHSDSEKSTIEKYAQKIAGDGNVTDELTIKTDSK